MESQESNKRYILITGNITCQFFQLTSSVWTYGVSCTSKQEFEKTNNIKLEVIENDFEDAGYYSISALYTDTESDVEIIGNIYDNPELIKEEEK